MLGSSNMYEAGGASAAIDGATLTRRQDSRKRRRVSERRRAFSRLGGLNSGESSFASSTSGRRTSRPVVGALKSDFRTMDLEDDVSFNQYKRSDSPVLGQADHSKISMKIQFHITPVGQDTEPLILDASHFGLVADDSHIGGPPAAAPTQTLEPQNIERKKSTTDIGDHIHERLCRQNTLSTRRRQQLLALHNQSAMDAQNSHQRDRLASMTEMPGESGGGRESGARSSTITGGMQDEATARFLARQQMRPANSLTSSGGSLGPSASSATLGRPGGGAEREHIYFKRDGQRFGHEFTLKLAVDKNYRCLLKVRPLIPLQGITIQGHHVAFVDCSLHPNAVGSLSSSAPSIVSSALSSSRQSIGASRATNGMTTSSSKPSNHLISNHSSQTTSIHPNRSHQNNNNNHHHRLSHAQTTAITPIKNNNSCPVDRRVSSALITSDHHHHQNPQNAHSLSLTSSRQLQQQLLKQQQHNQMTRHFAASHCSPSGSHLGSQLLYMFDWSAARFEVNKNKARTQIQTVLKFKNGEILSLPLQVKFYQPESRQHLNWGSQLHFIDYDCNINNMGQINVERIQYY